MWLHGLQHFPVPGLGYQRRRQPDVTVPIGRSHTHYTAFHETTTYLREEAERIVDMLENVIANNEVNGVVLNRPMCPVFNQAEFVYVRVFLSSQVNIDADHVSHLSPQDTQLLAEQHRVSGSARPATTAKIKDPKMGS